MLPALTQLCDSAVSLRVRAEHIRVGLNCCSPTSVLRRTLTADLDTPKSSEEDRRRSDDHAGMRSKTFILRGEVQDCKEPIPVRMLVDSGSSDCFVALSFVCKHHVPMRRARKRHMICAAGQRASILGVVSLSLLFEGRRLNGDFYVVRHIDHYTPIILGDDILRSTRAILDYGACKVTIHLRDDSAMHLDGNREDTDSDDGKTRQTHEVIGRAEQKKEGTPDPRA